MKSTPSTLLAPYAHAVLSKRNKREDEKINFGYLRVFCSVGGLIERRPSVGHFGTRGFFGKRESHEIYTIYAAGTLRPCGVEQTKQTGGRENQLWVPASFLLCRWTHREATLCGSLWDTWIFWQT